MWTYNNELYHYGVLGMKWGVRKQSDRSSTGRRKGKQRKFYIRNKQQRYEYYAKNMREAYPKVTKKQVDRAARNSEILRKVLLATAAVAITGVAAYGATRLGKQYLGTTIKAGQRLARIEGAGTNKLHDVFYAAYGKHDVSRYRNLYGAQLRGNLYPRVGNNPVSLSIKATKKLKIASHNAAQKEFEKVLSKSPELQKRYADCLTIKNAYQRFNAEIPDLKGTKELESFYSGLKKKGYHGIIDVNDQSLSGYNSKKPLIIFGGKDRVVVESSNKVFDEKTVNLDYLNRKIYRELGTIQKEKAREAAIAESMPYIGIAGVASGAAAAPASVGTNNNKKRKKRTG